MLLMELALAGTALAGDLPMNQGTIELGGRATANIVMSGGNTDLYLDLSPQIGYFVGRRIELLGGVSMLVNDNDLDVGFYGGVDVFLRANHLSPYLGGTLGYATGAFGPTPWAYAVGADVVTLSGRGGLVLPVSNSVGVDLGARLNVNIPDGGNSWVHLPLGYLGIRAFL
ncbi:MAG: hypothetical protein R3F59_12330 [Myxococcota bacterium]